MATTKEQEQFIMDWIGENGGVDVCDTAFHDAFHAEFGGARSYYTRGAQPVRKAMARIANLYRRGVLQRGTVGLGGGGLSGFPKWVYVYQLLKEGDL